MSEGCHQGGFLDELALELFADWYSSDDILHTILIADNIGTQ